MSNDDPFTLDLFNTTTLSSDLGLGVTAFGSDFGDGDQKSDRQPAAPAPRHAPAGAPFTSRPGGVSAEVA